MIRYVLWMGSVLSRYSYQSFFQGTPFPSRREAPAGRSSGRSGGQGAVRRSEQNPRLCRDRPEGLGQFCLCPFFFSRVFRSIPATMTRLAIIYGLVPLLQRYLFLCEILLQLATSCDFTFFLLINQCELI